MSMWAFLAHVDEPADLVILFFNHQRQRFLPSSSHCQSWPSLPQDDRPRDSCVNDQCILRGTCTGIIGKFGGEQAVVRDAAPVEPSKQWLEPLGMLEQDRNPWR